MTSFDNDFFKREKFQSSITVLFQGIQEEFWKSILDVFLNRHLYSIWPRDFQCLLLCTAMASIAKHYTFLWMWVNLYCQSFDPFFLSFPLFFPHFFFAVYLVLILSADPLCGTRKIPPLISEIFFNLRQYNYITQANSNICFGSSRVDFLYRGKIYILYIYLPVSKTWNQVTWEKIMGKYFSLCFLQLLHGFLLS